MRWNWRVVGSGLSKLTVGWPPKQVGDGRLRPMSHPQLSVANVLCGQVSELIMD